jgi:hypothetical protein
MSLPKHLARLSACSVALAFASSTLAVQLSTNGEGEVLIFPYYIARDGNVTLVSLVNSSSATKVLRVNVQEGKNALDVGDFELYLAAGDVWTAAIVATDTGARLITADSSCTAPKLSSFNELQQGAATFDAPALNTRDRGREGQIQVMEGNSIKLGSPTDIDVSPNASGSRDCKMISNAARRRNAADYVPSTGRLSGSATIVSNSTSTSYQAIALQGFGAQGQELAIPFHLGSGTSNRAFIHETDPSGVSRYIVAEFDGLLGPYNAVQAVLMQASISGEYTTDDVFATDWVLTMPTKRPSVNTVGSAYPPFQNLWNGRNPNATPLGTACDDMNYRLQDREAKLVSSTGSVSSQLCWASNVVSVKPTTGSTANSPLASINASSMMVSSPGSGWGTIDLTGASAHKLVSNANSRIYTFASDGSTSVKTGPITFHGLPVVGVALYAAKFSRTQDNYSSSANLIGRARITQ